MLNNITILNWSATDTLDATVQWKDKQHWSADQSKRSHQSILLVVMHSLAIFFPYVGVIRRPVEPVLMAVRPVGC